VHKRLYPDYFLVLILLFTGFICCDSCADLYDFSMKIQNNTPFSSDLLQIIEKMYCPPGQTPDDIIDSFEKTGQIRRNETGSWSVHVTIEFDKNTDPDHIIEFLNDSDYDTTYRLVTGWATSENLTKISTINGITGITPVFPSLHSGSLEKLEDNDSVLQTPDNSWKSKLSTDLLQLVDDQYLSPGQSRADSMALMEKTGEVRISGTDIEVRISAKFSPSSSPDELESFFTQPVRDAQYGKIGGWIKVSEITRLAMQKSILSLMVQIPPRTSKVRSEGDFILKTWDYRNHTGISGEGICIGVISDGVDGLSDLQAIGELSDVLVLSDSVGGDEGTAMLQIIHDIAPNATLIFHDRGESQIEYVKALDQLIIHGCRIICDDITYVEPFFEDGYISQNIIDRILSYHILSITAAGNFAQEHYQVSFSGYEDQGYKWHNFNSSKGKDMHFSVPSGIAGHVILQWDDRFGASSNNYDLFLYDESGREIGRSVNLQDGDDDPMEWVRFANSGDKDKEYRVRIVQAAADDALLELYVLPISGRSIITDPNTPEDSVFGQQAVSNALTVGAIAPDIRQIHVQNYSSKGPVYIKYPVPEKRKKPDIVAPDHIVVLTGSLQQALFTGTSAAAPHIAGLAALIWSAEPTLHESEVRNIILNISYNPAGREKWNSDSGYGLPSAEQITNIFNWSFSKKKEIIPITNPFEPRNYEKAGNISLYSGWNMISIPYPLQEGKITSEIFRDIETKSHSIWRYDAGNQRWSPVKADDTFRQMDVIWIFSAESNGLFLPLDGSGLNQTFLELHTGWNPAGVPGKESITAQELLSPLSDAWTTVLVYDSKAQSFRPSIVNGGTGTYSPNRLLYPSEGWWVYMNRPGIMFPVC